MPVMYPRSSGSSTSRGSADSRPIRSTADHGTTLTQDADDQVRPYEASVAAWMGMGCGNSSSGVPSTRFSASREHGYPAQGARRSPRTRREDRVKFCSKVKFEHGSSGWGGAPLVLGVRR